MVLEAQENKEISISPLNLSELMFFFSKLTLFKRFETF